MTKIKNKKSTLLKRRIKLTKNGKLIFYKRCRIKTCSFSYGKKKIKHLFSNNKANISPANRKKVLSIVGK